MHGNSINWTLRKEESAGAQTSGARGRREGGHANLVTPFALSRADSVGVDKEASIIYLAPSVRRQKFKTIKTANKVVACIIAPCSLS